MSRNELVQCDREGCAEWFTKKTHNQRYHDNECCKIATNARIMEKYYENRDRKQGKARYCIQCGQTKLSQYNESKICSGCRKKKRVAANDALRTRISNSSLIA